MFYNIVDFGNKENLVNHRICPSWIADLFNIFVYIQVKSPSHHDRYKKTNVSNLIINLVFRISIYNA